MALLRTGTLNMAMRTSLRRHASSLNHVTSAVPSVDESDTRSYKDIPGPRGLYRWPLVGTMLNFKPFTPFTPEHTHQLLREMYKKYGPLFRLQLGKDTVVASDTRDIETVYRNEGKFPSRPNLDLREVYARRSGVKSMDVATLQGDEWLSVRTPLNKRLVKVDSATYYLKSQNLVADDFVKLLTNQEMSPADVSDLFFRFASESIGVVCFNTRLGFLDEAAMKDPKTVEFLNAAKDAFTMLHRSFTGDSVAHGLYRNETYRVFEHAVQTMNRYAREHILKAKQELRRQSGEETHKRSEPNLLLSLVSDTSLNDDWVSQIVESLYTAGTDSTAGSIQALFYNLARNPDKQEILHSEIVNVIGRDQPVTSEALNQMPYLKACVKESFRVLYPISGVMRVLPSDIVLSGYRVPAGVQILLANVLTCQTHFSDPDKYLPERWLRSSEGRRQEDIPRSAVLPFGYGPRNCVGRRFAEQEIYLAVTKVLQKLTIGLDNPTVPTMFVHRIFLQPALPVHFVFKPRSYR